MPTPVSTPTVYTVTQLTTGMRSTLERVFPDVWVEGEISNLRIPASGHAYFSLNDAHSQLRAVAFRRLVETLPFTLEDGLMALVRGRVSVYEPRGDCQMLLTSLEPKGLGALQVAFEQRKRALGKEGLFDPARKRPLPSFPRRVGVITSGTGAALHDIVTVTHRRCPLIAIRIFPVAVQGPDAARQIADAITLANDHRDLDVLIVGRGGGSWEDLWSFNEEVVVRAIAGSRLPVVSAVGHAVDVTLSDWAADCRAPTPSAAAELVSPVMADVRDDLVDTHRRLAHVLRQGLARRRDRVAAAAVALPHPAHVIRRRMQRIDELAARLGGRMRAALSDARPTLTALSAGLVRSGLGQSWRRARLVVPHLSNQLHRAMPSLMARHAQRLRAATGTLHALSPLAILSRGYGIIETIPGRDIVTHAASVRAGDRIRARLAEGSLACLVEDVEPASSILTSRDHGV